MPDTPNAGYIAATNSASGSSDLGPTPEGSYIVDVPASSSGSEPNTSTAGGSTPSPAAAAPDYPGVPGIKDYNEAFVDVTSDYPVAAIAMDIRMVTDNGEFRVFPLTDPNTSEDPPTDIVDAKVKDIEVNHNYYFVRGLTLQRVSHVGGNMLTVDLIDQTARIVDVNVIENYLMTFVKSSKGCHFKVKWGWDAGGKGKTRWVNEDRAFILMGIQVRVEPTGIGYSLTLVDLASQILNSTPPGWTKNIEAKGTELWSLPQAIAGNWRSMEIAGCHIRNKAEAHLVAKSSTDDSYLGVSAFTKGDGWTKEGKKRAFNGWTIGDLSFMAWLQGSLSKNLDDADKPWMYQIVTPGRYIDGNPSDFQVYRPSGGGGGTTSALEISDLSPWSSLGSMAIYDSEKNAWTPAPGMNFIMIVKDKIKELAAARNQAISDGGSDSSLQNVSSMQGNFPVGKKYLYAYPGVHRNATVIRLDIASSEFLQWYAMKASQAHLSTGVPTDEEENSKMPEKAMMATSQSCDVAATPGTTESNPQHPIEDASTAQALKLSESGVGFISMPATLTVIGDPDLSYLMYKAVQIDFDSSAGPVAPWIKGTYAILGITESIADGFWQSSLDLFKLGASKRAAAPPGQSEEANPNGSSDQAGADQPNPAEVLDVSQYPGGSASAAMSELKKLINEWISLGTNGPFPPIGAILMTIINAIAALASMLGGLSAGFNTFSGIHASVNASFGLSPGEAGNMSASLQTAVQLAGSVYTSPPVTAMQIPTTVTVSSNASTSSNTTGNLPAASLGIDFTDPAVPYRMAVTAAGMEFGATCITNAFTAASKDYVALKEEEINSEPIKVDPDEMLIVKLIQEELATLQAQVVPGSLTCDQTSILERIKSLQQALVTIKSQLDDRKIRSELVSTGVVSMPFDFVFPYIMCEVCSDAYSELGTCQRRMAILSFLCESSGIGSIPWMVSNGIIEHPECACEVGNLRDYC